MVLIGDPKQAIYAFRGGDIVTYLAGRRDRHAPRQTLGRQLALRPARCSTRSRRCSQGAAARRRAHRRAPRRGAPPRAPGCRVPARRSGCGSSAAPSSARARGPSRPVALWRDHVITDTAHDIKRLLESRRHLRRTRPAARRHRRARRAAQRARGRCSRRSPPSASRRSSTPAARSSTRPPPSEWLVLLEALEQPHRADRVRAAALTSFFGHTAASLDAGGDDLTDDLTDRVRTLADVFTARGVAAVLEVRGRRRADRPRAGAGRRRAHAHRPAPHRRVAASGQRRGAARRRRAARLAARAGRRRQARGRLRADPPPRLRRRGRPARHDPRQQGPAVPGRLPPDPVEPLHRARPGGARCSTTTRADGAATSAGRAPSTASRLRPALARGRRRVAAPALRRADAGPVAGRRVVRRGRAQHPGLAAAPDALRSPARAWRRSRTSRPLVDEDRLVEHPRPRGRTAGGPRIELADADPARPDPPRALDRAPRRARRSPARSTPSWRRTSYSSLSAASAATRRGDLSRARGRARRGLRRLGRGPRRSRRPGPRRRGGHRVGAVADGRPAGRARRSARSCTRSSSTPTRPRDDFRGRAAAARSSEQLVWWPVELDPDELADALVAVCTQPAGPARRRSHAAATSACPTGCASSTSSCRSRAATSRVRRAADVRLGDLAPLLRRHLPEGDPVLVYADTLDGDPDLAAQSAARLPHRLDRRRAAARRRRARALPDRRLQDQLARRPIDAAADRPRLPPRACSTRRWATPTTRSRRCSTPSCCTASCAGGCRLRPGDAPRRRALPLPARHVRPGDAAASTAQPCGVFSWRPPVALVEELSDLLDGVLAKRSR